VGTIIYYQPGNSASTKPKRCTRHNYLCQ